MVSVVSWVDFSIDAFWTDGLSGDSAFGKYAVKMEPTMTPINAVAIDILVRRDCFLIITRFNSCCSSIMDLLR